MSDEKPEARALQKLTRGIVWCTTCGAMRRLPRSPDWHLANGWPKCCGYTMTIDSPEERAARGSND